MKGLREREGRGVKGEKREESMREEVKGDEGR